MKTILLIIMVATVLESLVEYFKTILRMFEESDYKTAITQLATIVLGIGFAFAFHTQLFNGALSEVYEGIDVNKTFDMILTGILFSRGSNYISDLWKALTKKPETIYEYDEDGIVDEFDDEDYDEDQETLIKDAVEEKIKEGDE